MKTFTCSYDRYSPIYAGGGCWERMDLGLWAKTVGHIIFWSGHKAHEANLIVTIFPNPGGFFSFLLYKSLKLALAYLGHYRLRPKIGR